MTSRHMVDPELLPLLDLFPTMTFDQTALAAARQQTAEMAAAVSLGDLAVPCEPITIPGRDGAPPVRAVLVKPHGLTSTAAAILHIHGGGYVLGSPEISLPDLMVTAQEVGCIILSVDYRLAPETHAPGAVEDCYTALAWLWTQAPTLGVDRTRIATMGESAGGGLAAALALLARDRAVFPLVFQSLDSPMLDDRTCLRPAHPVNGEYIWTADSNRFAWTALLGEAPGGPTVSPYASPSRADDVSLLPATFISCGALDLFLDENLEYARRLAHAGVAVELHIHPGAYHGYTMAKAAAVTDAARRDRHAALRRALKSIGSARVDHGIMPQP